MTKKRDLKALVRERMEKTGESYMIARSAVTKTVEACEHPKPWAMRIEMEASGPDYVFTCERCSREQNTDDLKFMNVAEAQAYASGLKDPELVTPAEIAEEERRIEARLRAGLGQRIECIFCHALFDGMAGLKEHSAQCPEHPAVKEAYRLREMDRMTAAELRELLTDAENDLRTKGLSEDKLVDLRAFANPVPVEFAEWAELARATTRAEEREKRMGKVTRNDLAGELEKNLELYRADAAHQAGHMSKLERAQTYLRVMGDSAPPAIKEFVARLMQPSSASGCTHPKAFMSVGAERWECQDCHTVKNFPAIEPETAMAAAKARAPESPALKPSPTELMKQAFKAWGITTSPDGKLVGPDGKKLRARWSKEETDDTLRDLKIFHSVDAEAELARATLDAVLVSVLEARDEPACTCSYKDSEEMTGHAMLCAVSKAARANAEAKKITAEQRFIDEQAAEVKRHEKVMPTEFRRGPTPTELKGKATHGASDLYAKGPGCTCPEGAWGGDDECPFHHPPVVTPSAPDFVQQFDGVFTPKNVGVDVAQKLVDAAFEEHKKSLSLFSRDFEAELAAGKITVAEKDRLVFNREKARAEMDAGIETRNEGREHPRPNEPSQAVMRSLVTSEPSPENPNGITTVVTVDTSGMTPEEATAVLAGVKKEFNETNAKAETQRFYLLESFNSKLPQGGPSLQKPAVLLTPTEFAEWMHNVGLKVPPGEKVEDLGDGSHHYSDIDYRWRRVEGAMAPPKFTRIRGLKGEPDEYVPTGTVEDELIADIKRREAEAVDAHSLRHLFSGDYLDEKRTEIATDGALKREAVERYLGRDTDGRPTCCEQYGEPVQSSVNEEAWVHPRTPTGRLVCRVKGSAARDKAFPHFSVKKDQPDAEPIRGLTKDVAYYDDANFADGTKADAVPNLTGFKRKSCGHIGEVTHCEVCRADKKIRSLRVSSDLNEKREFFDAERKEWRPAIDIEVNGRTVLVGSSLNYAQALHLADMDDEHYRWVTYEEAGGKRGNLFRGGAPVPIYRAYTMKVTVEDREPNAVDLFGGDTETPCSCDHDDNADCLFHHPLTSKDSLLSGQNPERVLRKGAGVSTPIAYGCCTWCHERYPVFMTRGRRCNACGHAPVEFIRVCGDCGSLMGAHEKGRRHEPVCPEPEDRENPAPEFVTCSVNGKKQRLPNLLTYVALMHALKLDPDRTLSVVYSYLWAPDRPKQDPKADREDPHGHRREPGTLYRGKTVRVTPNMVITAMATGNA